jgi:uncharacterized protein (TIGR03083 family)
MEPLAPIDVIDLFPGERAALLAVLSDLSEQEWAAPTACPGWSAKDVALHLLGDDVGLLSRGRDGFANPSFARPGLDLSTFSGLVAAIDAQNAAWVEGTRRISPRLLVELLRFTGEQTQDHFRRLEPGAVGEPVEWAGPGPAPVWLDLAREYTERWVHQQHIRDAVDRPGLKDRRSFGPVLETFAYALPRAMQESAAPDGTAVQLTVLGESGGEWVAIRADGTWVVGKGPDRMAAASVAIDQDVAWRLFTKGLTAADARRVATIEGDRRLADRVLDAVAILA